jgi:predicted dehydrogenase
VLVTTPDRWHALPMIAAVEAAADVYVQKPISLDVTEGRAMLAASRKHKRVVQVGTTRRGCNCSPWPTTWRNLCGSWPCRGRSVVGT